MASIYILVWHNSLRTLSFQSYRLILTLKDPTFFFTHSSTRKAKVIGTTSVSRRISLFLTLKLEAKLNLKIGLNNNFLEYSQIQIHQAYTFKDSSIPNTQKDLELLKRYSSTTHDYVKNKSLIQSFLHCDIPKYSFHFHPTSQYYPLTSLTVEIKYQTSTHLVHFPPYMVEDQMTRDYKDTLR